MLARPVLLLVLAGLTGTHGADARRYRIEYSGTVSAVTIQQGPGGTVPSVETRPRTAAAELTLSLGDTAGGRTVVATLDTLEVPEPRGMRMTAPSPTGSTWRGMVAARGPRVQLASSGSPRARMVDEALVWLLPAVPASLRPGLAWSDTTVADVTGDGSRSESRIVSHYRVTGDAAGGVTLARRFEAVRTSRMTGRAGDGLIEAKLHGTATYEVEPSGGIRAARIVRDQTATMHVGDADPISSTTSDTLVITRMR